MHEGVDLLAPIGTPVFAAASGEVVSASDSSVLIRHDAGAPFVTFYQHMRNIVVDAADAVSAGQRIGEVDDFPNSSEDHLHFEVRALHDAGTASRGRSLPMDPTDALYQWEVRTFQNDADARRDHIFDDVLITGLEEVWRARLLRFLLVNVSGTRKDLFVPLVDPSPANRSMAETLKLAFFHARRVRIVWRESLFFSGIQSTEERVGVVAEVKVTAG
jgi:hypothetical protein